MVVSFSFPLPVVTLHNLLQRVTTCQVLKFVKSFNLKYLYIMLLNSKLNISLFSRAHEIGQVLSIGQLLDNIA